MQELQEKTTAAIIKQVELLNEDGVPYSDKEMANQSINSLTALLSVINQM